MEDLPKIVLSRLRKSAAVEPHLDANQLTAFAELSLADPERARVMEHLAGCIECREVVALALPDTETVAVNSSIRGTRNNWFAWPVLRSGIGGWGIGGWTIVAACVLAVTSVGIVQYKHRQQSSATPAPTLMARGDASSIAHDLQPSPPASEGQVVSPKTQVISPQTETMLADTRKQVLPNRNDVSSVGRRNESSNAGNAILTKSYGVRSSVSSGAQVSGGFGGRLAPSPNSSKKNLTASSVEPPSAQAADRKVEMPASSEMVEVQSGAETVTTAKDQVADQLIQNQENSLRNPSFRKSGVVTPDVVKAKDAAPPQAAGGASAQTPGPSDMPGQAAPTLQRWTISSSGVLQRSFDAGKTWADVTISPESELRRSRVPNVTADGEKKLQKQGEQSAAHSTLIFRAVTAIGPEVWVGGSGAMLFHSADSGGHWTRVVPASAAATLAGDITSVEFSDPQRGRVTTSEGEVWITADNGQTWFLQ